MDVTDRVLKWIAGEGTPDDLPAFLAHHGRVFRNWHRALLDATSGLEMLDLTATMRRIKERHRYIRELGFAIPTREAIDLLASHGPLIEIGAGTGMWSALLARHGVDVIATDPEPAGEQGSYSFVVGAHHPTEQLQGKTAVRRYRDRNVFCSWPTYDHTWFRQAARAMRIGRRLIVVRENATADESAWNYVDRAFVFEADLEIPCFEHMHDHIEVWLKKREVRRSAIDALRDSDDD